MKVSIYWSFDPHQDRTFYWLHTSDEPSCYSHDVLLYWHYGPADDGALISSIVLHNDSFEMLYCKFDGVIKDIKVIPSDSLDGNCMFVLKDMEVLSFTV